MNPAGTRKRLERHGMIRSPEYFSWKNAKARCNDPDQSAYEHYGGRGIRMCQRWTDSFVAFYRDMGPRPSPRHSLDRIDFNGNYEPSNCRWATMKEQANNTRYVRWITFNGQTKTLSEWAASAGCSVQALHRRLDIHHWPLERALTTPTLTYAESQALALAGRHIVNHRSPAD